MVARPSSEYFGRAAASALVRMLAALSAVLALAPDAAAAEEDQRKSLAAGASGCTECGVVRTIREIRTERKLSRPDIYVTSPQYLDTRPNDPPNIGPVLSLSWGRNDQTQARIGAVGSAEMQQRFTEITYEVIVRFDDGRFGSIEQDDASDLRVGDRVVVADRKVARVK